METVTADEALILALAAGVKPRAAGRRAGCSERTVYRRLEQPDFRRRVTSARDAMLAEAAGGLAAAANEAVGALRGLLKSKSETVRLGAVRAVFEYASQFRRTVDEETRICQIEQHLFGERDHRKDDT
jgi:hypothetical protein